MGTNLSFKSVETTSGTETVHYDSSIRNIESVSLYGSFHGQTGEGISGVFHDNADLPTLVGAIIGRTIGTSPIPALQTGIIHRLPDADGGQVFYYKNINSRNHFILSIGDTHYPSVPVQGANFDATSGSATYGEYGDANRTYLATGIFNKNFDDVYGFAGYSVRGQGNALDANGNTIPVLDDDGMPVLDNNGNPVLRTNDDLLKQVYTEFVGPFPANHQGNNWISHGRNWEVRVGGPPVETLPTGTFEYGGLVTVLDKTESNIKMTRVNNQTQFQMEEQYIFDMNVNFDMNNGSIGAHSQHTELLNKLSGNFVINPTDGTFMGTNLDFNERTQAALYGSFHGPNAEGVAGVFHGISDTNIVGSIIGGKKSLLRMTYAENKNPKE